VAEVLDRLEKEIDKLSARFDDLDSRLRKFEAAATAGMILAVVFGIAGSVGGYFLKAEADAIRKVQDDTVAIMNLNANIVSLQKAVSAISSDVGRAGLPVLEARIKNFTSAAAPANYGYADYLADMESLSNFAVEYLALIQDRNNPINPVDSGVLLSDLKAAAGAAKRRAEGLKLLKDKDFDGHIKAPENFNHLVDYLIRHQGIPLSDDEVMCYQAAFPNWKYHITHAPTDSPNSPHCQSTIQIGPA
jgi:hypothetical protein